MFKTIKSIFRGLVGEFKANALNSAALSKDFYIINNLTVNTHNSEAGTETTQIDSVLISKQHEKIICVEIKNYRGEISGDINEKQWQTTYQSYKEPKIYPTYNPLFQNYAHIKAIQNILKDKLGVDMSLDKFESIVYYNGDSQLKITNNKKDDRKNNHLFSPSCIVDNYKEYIKTINNIIEREFFVSQTNKKNASEHITMKQNKEIYEILKQEDLTNGLNLKSIGNYMKHVKQQKRKFK